MCRGPPFAPVTATWNTSGPATVAGAVKDGDKLDVGWWSPDPRGVIPIDGLRINDTVFDFEETGVTTLLLSCRSADEVRQIAETVA